MHLVAGHPHAPGQLGVVNHVAVLAVDRDEGLGLGHRQQGLQLALAGVAAHVDRLGARMDDLGALAVQLVDDPADRPLVARDGVGADDDHVAILDAEPLVVAGGHQREGRHGLALRAGRDDADLAVGEPVDLLDVHQDPVGDLEDPQSPGQLDVLAHRPPEGGHLAPAGHGGVDHLLDAVDVAGEAGHHDAVALAGQEDPSQGGPHRALRGGEAGLLGVGRVAQQQADALLGGQRPDAGQVGPPAVDRLEVAA